MDCFFAHTGTVPLRPLHSSVVKGDWCAERQVIARLAFPCLPNDPARRLEAKYFVLQSQYLVLCG
jgi:hypothetical protein